MENRSTPSMIRITGFKIPPWADVVIEDSKQRVTGLSAPLLQYLGQALNFSYNFVTPVAAEYGRKTENGSWTGVLGMLQRGDIDIASVPTVPVPSRMGIMYFSSPYWYTSSVLLSGRPRGYSSDPFAYLLAFKIQVWIALVLSLVVISGVGFITDKVNIWRKDYRHVYGLGTHFWSFMGIVFYQSSEHVPHRREGKTIFIIWCFIVMILMNIFGGNMKARLTAHGDPERINSLADLTRYPNVRPLLVERSAISAYFEFSNDVVRLSVWKQVIKTRGAIPGPHLFVSKNLDDTYVGDSVIINEENIILYRLAEHCSSDREFHIGEHQFQDMSFAFPISKHLSPSFVEDLNTRILQYYDSGHMHYHMARMYYKVQACLSKKWINLDVVMTLKSMSPVFLLWFIGISTSTVCFLFEMITSRFNRLTRKRLFKQRYHKTEIKTIDYQLIKAID